MTRAEMTKRLEDTLRAGIATRDPLHTWSALFVEPASASTFLAICITGEHRELVTGVGYPEFVWVRSGESGDNSYWEFKSVTASADWDYFLEAVAAVYDIKEGNTA